MAKPTVRKPAPAPKTPAEQRLDLIASLEGTAAYTARQFARDAKNAQTEIDKWSDDLKTSPSYALDWIHNLRNAAAKLEVATYLQAELEVAGGDVEKLVEVATAKLIQVASWMGGQDIDEVKARFVSRLADQVRDLSFAAKEMSKMRAAIAMLDIEAAANIERLVEAATA